MYSIQNSWPIIFATIKFYDENEKYVGELILENETRTVSKNIKYVANSDNLIKNRFQCFVLLKILNHISSKGSERNLVFSTDIEYFDKLFNEKLLEKFKNSNWTKKDNTKVANYDILEDIYNTSNDNGVCIYHNLVGSEVNV